MMGLRVVIDDDLVEYLSNFMKDENLSDFDEAANEALADYFNVDQGAEEVEEEEEIPLRNRR